MSEIVRIEVHGHPAPQGSKSAGVTKEGVPFMRENNRRTKPWRQEVSHAAVFKLQHITNVEMCPQWSRGQPVAVGYVYRFALGKKYKNPKTGALKRDVPLWVPTKPDLDKLDRAINDALTSAGLVWDDDSQVALQTSAKVYVPPGEWVGVVILLAPIDLWFEVMKSMRYEIQAGEAARLWAISDPERGRRRRT